MAQLKLGSIDLWAPPHVYSELTGMKPNYSSTACGSTLDSYDLTYKIYLGHYCTLADTQRLEAAIENELMLAPSLSLIRQETPDALVFKNNVKSGQLALSSDLTEIRARFTPNRTLVFLLTLTILPNGIGGAAPFRSVKFLAATGAFDWVGDDIRAALYQDGSTIPNELYVEALSDFVNPLEADGVGYARVAVTGRQVYNGSTLELVMDEIAFGPEANSSAQLTGMLIYQHNGADSTNIPLFDVGIEPFQPNGAPKSFHVILPGLF